MRWIMAAVLLTAAIASPVLAQGQVPFRGTFEGVDSDAGGAFPIFLRSLNGTGHASHLGRFTMTAEFQINVLTYPIEGVGSFTFTAANGDSLFGTTTGLGTQDIRITVMSIVRVIIGFIGILAILLALYAGWLWMSSAGKLTRLTKLKEF